MSNVPSLSATKSSPWEEKPRTCSDAASFRAFAEGSATSSPLRLTAMSVEVNVTVNGKDVESKARIEDCSNAGKSGRFYGMGHYGCHSGQRKILTEAD